MDAAAVNYSYGGGLCQNYVIAWLLAVPCDHGASVSYVPVELVTFTTAVLQYNSGC